jgi:hypothetical protein
MQPDSAVMFSTPPAAPFARAPGAAPVAHTYTARAPARVTPGLILHSLSPERARELEQTAAALLREPCPLCDASPGGPHSPAARTRTLLQLLSTDELRALAARVHAPTHGGFLELYHRLAPPS